MFDADRSGINDSVSITPIRGQMIDSTCVFTDSRVWFFDYREAGFEVVNRAQVITADGKVEATAEAELGDGSWLERFEVSCLWVTPY